MVPKRGQGAQKQDFGAKLVPKGRTNHQNGSQSDPKSPKVTQNGPQGPPECTQKGAETSKGPPKRSPTEKYRILMPKRCTAGLFLGAILVHFLSKIH